MLRIVLAIIFMMVVFISCGQSTTEMPEKISYTPLAIGDKTQIIYLADSSTTSLEIVDIVERKDGQKVYRGFFKMGSQIPSVSYYLVSDGFFKSTELDTVPDDTLLQKVNPFREQRLAKSYPENGETWLHTIGDPSADYFIANHIDSFSPLWGEVKDVYRYDLYNKYASTPFLAIYYGPDLGWLGTGSRTDTGLAPLFICSYKNVSGTEHGELWPEKDVSLFYKNNSHLHKNILSKSLVSGFHFTLNGEKFLKDETKDNAD